MYFLGQASTYSFLETLRHTFSYGTKNNLSELRAYLAAHYGTTKDRVALYHSGRTGLAMALDRLVPKESEVIVTSLTCYAVYEAVSEAGCIPVFADIDLETLHFGVKELKNTLALHPEAQAVVVQNNLGIPCDIRGIERFCKKYGLILIEDLAHSVGIHYRDGREAGTVGDAVILSFGKGKAVDTISGGAVVFTSPDSPTIKQPSRRPRLSDRLRDRWYPFFGLLIRGFYHFGNLGRLFTSLLLKLHFIKRSADAELEPLDRITYWQAKLALRQLKSIPHSGKKPIREPFFVEDREYLLKELEKGGFVFDDIWYSCPVSPARYYRRVNFPEDECPKAVWAAKHLMNLPTWYPKKDLKPARKLLERYLVKEEDIPDSSIDLPPELPESAKSPAKKTVKVSRKSETVSQKAAETPKTASPKPSKAPRRTKPASLESTPVLSDLDFALAELQAMPEEKLYEEGPEDEYDEEEPTTESAQTGIFNKGGSTRGTPSALRASGANAHEETYPLLKMHDSTPGDINYSEVVYDKLDRRHLNRTNIIDKNVNSDGTTVTPTKAERSPKKPTKDNLPEIRQYKKPEKGPETTQGKVW